jgi:hypothetical protein
MTGPRTKAGKALLAKYAACAAAAEQPWPSANIAATAFREAHDIALDLILAIEAEASAVPEGLLRALATKRGFYEADGHFTFDEFGASVRWHDVTQALAATPAKAEASAVPEGLREAQVERLIAAARQVLRSRDAIDKGSVGGASYRVAVGALDALDAAMTNPPAAATPAKAEGLDGDALLSILRYWFPDRDGKVYEVARQEAVAAILAATPAKAEAVVPADRKVATDPQSPMAWALLLGAAAFTVKDDDGNLCTMFLGDLNSVADRVQRQYDLHAPAKVERLARAIAPELRRPGPGNDDTRTPYQRALEYADRILARLAADTAMEGEDR